MVCGCLCVPAWPCRARVYLVVSAVPLLALAALQQVGAGASGFGHLVLPYGLLGENVPQLFQFIAGHLLHEKKKCHQMELRDVEVCSGRQEIHFGIDLARSRSVLDLSRHAGYAAQVNASCEDVSAKPGVLWVLQVADAASDPVFIFHIRGLCLLVDMCDRAVKVVLFIVTIGCQTPSFSFCQLALMTNN